MANRNQALDKPDDLPLDALGGRDLPDQENGTC